MCDAKPGDRCATDTRERATQTAEACRETHGDCPAIDPIAPVQTAAVIEPVETDEIEGACWEIPSDVDPSLAVECDIPLSQVDWWSISPQDDDWCDCGACPTVPTELPEDAQVFELCTGARVAHYAARMQAGDEFPAVQVLYDPDGQEWNGTIRHFLVDDGFHRTSAVRLLGKSHVPIELFAADHHAAVAALASH